MKVYFIDGISHIGGVDFLNALAAVPGKREDKFLLLSSYGFASNCKKIAELYDKNPNTILITDCTYALTNEIAWNEEEQKPDIYLYNAKTGGFVFIGECTDRELRQGHNIEMMYRNGAFHMPKMADIVDIIPPKNAKNDTKCTKNQKVGGKNGRNSKD